jgi:hypothetical protein
MALAACLLGFAVEIRHGLYDPTALLLLTLTILVCGVAVGAPRSLQIASLPKGLATALLLVGIVSQLAAILLHNYVYAFVNGGTLVIFALALPQAFNLGRFRWVCAALMLGAFAIVASRAFLLNWRDPHIDVYLFQQWTSDGLLHLRNPYTMRYPSLQPYGTTLYGRGVVDQNNWLTYGFPYPPFSLLMVLPAYVIGGDCRFGDVLAVAGTAAFMIAARPGRWAGLMATLFLLTPRVFFVVERSWTEPLLALTFSFVMFCHLRWKRGLPYALGLFFATKQYTILAVPLVWLLTDGPDRWAQFRSLMTRAIAVVLAITVPFVLWDVREFVRSVVEYQFVQPFRRDALSYLVWIKERFPDMPIRNVGVFYSVPPVAAFALWRSPRTASAFAAATTLVYLLFFAFNKQAFCNYYYFVIATACWAAVASPIAAKDLP